MDEKGKAAADRDNAKKEARALIEGDNFEWILLNECAPDDLETPLCYEPFCDYAVPALLLGFYALGKEEASIAVAKRLFEIWDSTSTPLNQCLQYFSEQERNQVWQTLDQYLQMAFSAKEAHGVDAFEDWINKSVLNVFDEEENLTMTIWSPPGSERFKAAMDVIRQEFPLDDRQESIFDVIEFAG